MSILAADLIQALVRAIQEDPEATVGIIDAEGNVRSLICVDIGTLRHTTGPEQESTCVFLGLHGLPCVHELLGDKHESDEEPLPGALLN